MSSLMRSVTDWVATKKGMWITLGSWLLITVLLAVLAPTAKEYEVTSIDSLPPEAPSVIAQNKVEQYFADEDGTPAIFIFQAEQQEFQVEDLGSFFEHIEEVEGLKQILPLPRIPLPVVESVFLSEDGSTLMVPALFHPDLESRELKTALGEIQDMAQGLDGYQLYITGPAGIAVDSLDLFSRADLVLLFSTVGLILLLLILIYRSPLLALIPLLAVAFVYEVVNQILGLMGKAGLLLSNQSLSIMTILLFAAVTDYSLFVFSRFREELKQYEDKYEAMRQAMRGTGLPVFLSGGTVLVAMLILFIAQFQDYKNFAPIFGTTMAVIMVASVTLIPALFTLFGRKSFWPQVPRVGEEALRPSAFWSRVGRAVVKRPVLTLLAVGAFLLLSATNLLSLQYEFDTMKSFPEDMPSRIGYEILAEKFESGELAPTTALLEAEEPITDEQEERLTQLLSNEPLVSEARVNNRTEDGKVVQWSITYRTNPYDLETIQALQGTIEKADQLLLESQIPGQLYFAGETASKVDERLINNRDLLFIAVLETIFIFGLLILLTRSWRLAMYMMGTILVSYLAALGLGLFLTDWFFGIETISDRVPVYTFVFLVALGIDYNIILVSRFLEERRKHPVKQAIERAVSATGGVISSAGIILAATFAVLMTQPVQVLFVFGFIVAVGIILDTFLVRGLLLPSIITLFEKDQSKEANKKVA